MIPMGSISMLPLLVVLPYPAVSTHHSNRDPDQADSEPETAPALVHTWSGPGPCEGQLLMGRELCVCVCVCVCGRGWGGGGGGGGGARACVRVCVCACVVPHFCARALARWCGCACVGYVSVCVSVCVCACGCV